MKSTIAEIPFKLVFSETAIYNFIFLGIGIFIILKLTKTFVPILLKNKNHRRFISKYFPLLELLVWIVFSIWSVQYFLLNHQLFALMLFLIFCIAILWTFHFAIKDFIAGVIFKASGRFSLNETIKSGETSGEITKFGKRALQIETEKGKTVFIPYSKILSEIAVKSDPAEMISIHTIRLATNKKQNLIETKEAIRIAILYLPWASIKKEPIIKPIDENKDSYTFEINVFSLEKEYFYKIETYLINKFGKK